LPLPPEGNRVRKIGRSMTTTPSSEVRRLTAKWNSSTSWPKRLEWIEIRGLRGWTGQRFELRYPIMAVVGENGAGKSTVLHSATAVYTPSATTPKRLVKGRGQFASDFFPNTAWDTITGAEIKYQGKEGDRPLSGTIRKPTKQWLGNNTRPTRPVVYIDLSRIQPIPARVGYSKLTKTSHSEASATPFDKYRLARLSQIMGREFDTAKMALANIDANRAVPVLGHQGASYSGFHQGAGETTITELLQTDLPKYSLVLIDEVETSLHPRAQRRLIRDLAERARELELQIILTTHSPYVLDELPFEARAHISLTEQGREVIYGVSPEFAMTKMDDVPQHECDVYVEDKRAQAMVTEILAKHAPLLILRCQIVPYGAASVGQSLGIMVKQKRFPRPSVVFLDGDQSDSQGCVRLRDDAPERVVFEELRQINWSKLAERIGRQHSAVVDACTQAMLLGNHHDWINHAASPLMLGGDIVWQAMCNIWADSCLNAEDAKKIVQPIEDALLGLS
jgi:predicted ATPase